MSKVLVSTQPYRGTRDFYPQDFIKRQYIFDTWTKVLTSLGYQQYDTPVLENAEMYILKSGEELGGKQLYNFYDKSERHIALRPEMTPSLARIVAAKFGELKFPLRWFSIPNCFRYERPQKGRLREFWQLNVDIIGLPAGGVDLEFLYMTTKLFEGFGASPNQFEIKFNHRQVLDKWIKDNRLTNHKGIIYNLLDSWHKTDLDYKERVLQEIDLDSKQIKKILSIKDDIEYYNIAMELDELKLIFENTSTAMPNVNISFDPTIVRGLAYYTGLVFEAFDTNPNNPRALFGGGRYDDLLDIFGKKAPAIGMGWGDVTMQNFLDNWNLWPQNLEGYTEKIGIMPFNNSDLAKIYKEILPKLQTEKIPFEIDYDYGRSENKRYESLKKRGCTQIIKIK